MPSNKISICTREFNSWGVTADESAPRATKVGVLAQVGAVLETKNVGSRLRADTEGLQVAGGLLDVVHGGCANVSILTSKYYKARREKLTLAVLAVAVGVVGTGKEGPSGRRIVVDVGTAVEEVGDTHAATLVPAPHQE